MSHDSRVHDVIRDATMPYVLGTAVKRYLKGTPGYQRARLEHRGRAFLDAEAYALGLKLAAVVREHLGELQ